MHMRKQEVVGVRSQRVIKVEEIDKLDHFKVLIALIPNVSSSGHEPNVIFLPQRWELMGSNLLIPLGLVSIIIDDSLPHFGILESWRSTQKVFHEIIPPKKRCWLH